MHELNKNQKGLRKMRLLNQQLENGCFKNNNISEVFHTEVFNEVVAVLIFLKHFEKK